MSNVVVKETHLTFGGVAYYRAHAEEVEIGSIGEKRKPLFKSNYLEVKDRVLVPELGLNSIMIAGQVAQAGALPQAVGRENDLFTAVTMAGPIRFRRR